MMEKKSPKSPRPKINIKRVEELMPAVTHRMSTAVRFRFNLSVQDALDLLASFYGFEVQNRFCNLELDEPTEDNLVEVASFITDKAPKFGLMFCGTVGNGKTTMMKAFRDCANYLDTCHHFEFLDNPDYGYRFRPEMRIVDVRDIVQAAKNDYSQFERIKKIQMLGIDDLGKEPAEILDYGNLLSPVIELIEYRYEQQMFTIITTNLVGKEIRLKYGDRIADRFNEMLKVIVFRNRTYRQKI